MTFDWYLIFNLTAFEALGLTSRTYTQFLEGIGQKDVLVTKGETVSLLYEGVMLSIELNDLNPFKFDGHAVYLDPETNDVYLGIAVES